MLELHAEIVVPAVVDRGVGDAVGSEFSGEGDAGTIEGKRVVGEGDAKDGYDRDEEDGCERKAGLDLVLIVAYEAEQSHDQYRQKIAIEESGGRCPGDEKEDVRSGEREEDGGELLPGEPGR
jgi:hypothetical protein